MTSQPLNPMQSENYKAAAEGKFDVFEKMEEREILNLLTPNKNTILHIHITACTDDKTGFVENALKTWPALLLQTNVKGETPLHMASRYGHERIAKLLIAHAKARGDQDLKNMLRVSNEQRDTALHVAVRFRNVDIVAMLLDQDPDLPNFVNKAGESPLYIAAERGYNGILCTLFDFCSSPATNGPNGRTALHASTIANDDVSTEKLLSKVVKLTRKADNKGWIPLHFAAQHGHLNITKLLLNYDRDSAYVQDKEGKTALHIAALKGNHEIMKEIMSVCPGCCELADNQSRNVLHFAVESDEKKAVKLILNDSSLSNLLHERTRFTGNTPLHHCVTTDSDESLDLLIDHPREDPKAFNDYNQNVYDIVWTHFGPSRPKHQDVILRLKRSNINRGHRIWISEEDKPQGRQNNNYDEKPNDPAIYAIDKQNEYNIIVAALIATVTFTSGFTVPGGYFSDESSLQGTAILGRKAAFKAFVMSNTLALVLSTLSIILHIAIIETRSHNWRKLMNTAVASMLTLASLTALVVAIVTGTYAVLSHYRSLAIAACVVGTSFFFFYALWSIKLRLPLQPRPNIGEI